MPIRPREITDQVSESRIRQIIRAILNQEVRRLNDANTSLVGDVATNTSNIAANAAAISANDDDIEYLERRLIGQE
jgi:hypothetical protein